MLKWQFKTQSGDNENIENSRKKLELYKECYLRKKKETDGKSIHHCHSCGGEISGEWISAGGNTYHEDCLECSVCGVKIEEEYFLVNGQILCEDDYNKV